MQCRFCGNENPDEQMNCSICGKELQNTLLRSLVGIDFNPNNIQRNDYNSSLGGIPKKGFEDTGGGAASGPRRSASDDIDEDRGSIGATVATVFAILAILAIAAYFFVISPSAPFHDKVYALLGLI